VNFHEVTLQREGIDNGYAALYKNHSAENDYGTNIVDVTTDGKSTQLTINANDQCAYLSNSTGQYKVTTQSDLSSYLPKYGGTMTGNMNSNSIAPNAPDTYYCGSSENYWKQIYCHHYYAKYADAIYARLYAHTAGTTTTDGVGRVLLGNNTPSGTNGNARGQIIMYGTSSGQSTIVTGNNSTSNITLTLPSVTGKIPVVSLSGTTLTITT
jgi:hypothetical protein